GRYLLNLDAQLPQLGAEKMGIRVPRFAGQDFVANDHDASGLRHAYCSRNEAVDSEIKLAAAHEKLAIRIRTSILTFLVDQLRAADWTIIPPVLLRNRIAWHTTVSGFFRHRKKPLTVVCHAIRFRNKTGGIIVQSAARS